MKEEVVEKNKVGKEKMNEREKMGKGKAELAEKKSQYRNFTNLKIHDL